MTKVFLLGANREIDTDVQAVSVNQVVQMEGYDYPRYVVYQISKGEGGNSYKLINLKNLSLSSTRIIRPLSDKFGIGIYFDEKNPQFKTDEEVAELLAKAQEQRANQMEKEREEEEEREKVRAVGRQWLQKNLPENAQAIIIACLKQDKSDIQTDYHASSTVRTVILGFSTHQRDLFSEMRKCAANFEETTHLAERNEDYEHREKYSMGKGYYLGQSYYSGWIIKKAPIYTRVGTINEFAYVAGNPDNIQIGAKSEKQPNLQTQEVVNTEGLHFEIVDYSEKAIALFGDTKEIKDQLSDKSGLNGRFNPRLTHNGGKKAGWIFQKSKLDALKQLINFQ